MCSQRSRPRSAAEPYTPDLFVPQHADLLAGVDEAGRGPLAGPVVAAAVMLHPGQRLEGLADSKTLSPKRREKLAERIRAEALCVAVAEASVEEIDHLNILQATLLAMQRAVALLRLRPTQIWVDGTQAPRVEVPVRTIIKGDAKVPEISAASILAKVHRDAWCARFHEEFPAYGFAAHKGYGTAEHVDQLRRLGPTPQHRRSFAPLREWLNAAR
jgi:ribonuclease HII